MSQNVKHTLFFLAFVLITLNLHAQVPVNDDCAGLIDLGVAPYCPDITIPGNETEIYSNVDATASDIGFGNNPLCFNGGTVQRDVWFAFTTSDTIFDYTITVMGVEGPNGEASIVNPQVALYRGACALNNLAELLCASAAQGETMVELDAEGLTPGITYFIRINDYSGTATPNAGSFKLCIDKKDPIDLITDGGSTNCSGELYDSGGPDGDYGNNENNVFTICPNQPNQCINFTLQYYNMEYNDFAVTDQLIFYDGDGTNPGTIITTLGGNDFGGTSATSGVCFAVQASSGCMTIQFISDGTSTFQGFAGSWECSSQACEINDPVTISPGASATEIEASLSTPFTQTTITNIDCDNAAYGTFIAGDNTDLGLNRGLVLTSGTAVGAIGPNNQAGVSTSLFTPGDDDLDVLSDLSGNGELSEDACVIELDVFVNTNELSFEYVFGSEEYPEFVNDIYNDIFAFLISGPGITGLPALNGQENIATIPGTNTFVEINSVNNLLNWEYYRNNQDGLSLQYDGLTSDYLGVKKSLTARATVEPCNTYHLKLAIADRGDNLFDSGVFVSELKGGTPELVVEFNSGIEYLIEDCTDIPDEVIFRLDNPLDEDITYNVVITGTATQGVDYLFSVPSQLTFVPGLNEITFPISVLSDLDDNEGIENIIIQLTNDFGCGLVELANLEILLYDQLIVDINAGSDTARVCANSDVILTVEGAANYFWTPVNLFDDVTSSTPTVTPTENGWVYVEGQVGNSCTAVDSIYLLILDPVIDIMEETIPTCQTQAVQLVANNNVSGEGLSWSPTTGLDDPTSATPMANPQVTTAYVATIDLGFGCTVADTVVVQVDFLNVPELAADTTICQNFGVTLSTLLDPNVASTTYTWIPGMSLDDPSSPTPLAFPDETTTYELIATTNNGACSASNSVTVTVLPADVAITNEPDTLQICLGESVTLNAQTSTGNNDNFLWTPNDGSLSSTTDLSVIATPITGTTYFTTFTVGSCTVMDSVYVQVDSLPAELGITVEPFEESYCQGELVTLVSPTYEPVLYPNITHQWLGLGLETSDTLYNLVFTTTDTFTYQRTTINGGCISVEEVTINVISNDEITITPAQPVICPGEQVQLTANSNTLGELEWSPAETLSCSDCATPIASPTNTTSYTLSSSVEGCAIEQSVTVTVLNPDDFTPIGNRTVCAGELPLSLNPNASPNATYVWTSNPAGFNSTEPNPSVNPAVTTTYIGTATNICGTITKEITITVIDPGSIISVAGGIDTLVTCLGFEFDLTANVDNSSNGTETLTWLYDGQSDVGADATFTAGNSGLATFIYQYGTSATNDCESLSETVYIQVNEAPQQVAVRPDTTLCFDAGTPLTLFTGTVEPGVDYNWTSTSGDVFMEADPEVSPTVTTTYTLEASLGACTSSTDVTITVIEATTLAIDEAASTNLIQEGVETLTLVAEAPNANNPAIEWTFNGINIGSGSPLDWTPDQTQQDLLPGYVFATISNTCQELIDSIFIQKLLFQMPNIFSPNGDGDNDVFKPFYLGEMDVVELTVYNRWGQVVFESNDPNNPGWDGKKGGKDAPSDVYIYTVRVGVGTETVQDNGQITLIR
ncbi:choice-of-anchor L domain-containing protein [Lewinella sp. LCG006]|uniref:choice-of-anchor L domain-containing protein n=1 Tax=Lewinella sp. LCG006 TaxID=3231911 RepID=UPI0034601A34